MKVVAGIDVGKTSLDVSVAAGPVRRFDNTPEAMAGLQAWLRSQAVTDVVCESTGGYERVLSAGVAGPSVVGACSPPQSRAALRPGGRPPRQDRRAGRAGAGAVWRGFDLPRLAQDAASRPCKTCCGGASSWLTSAYRSAIGRTEGARTSTQRHIQMKRSAGSRNIEGGGRKRRTGPSRRVSECARRRRVDRGYAGGVSAGVRPVPAARRSPRWWGWHHGPTTVGTTKAIAPSARTKPGAPGVVLGRLVGDATTTT